MIQFVRKLCCRSENLWSRKISFRKFVKHEKAQSCATDRKTRVEFMCRRSVIFKRFKKDSSFDKTNFVLIRPDGIFLLKIHGVQNPTSNSSVFLSSLTLEKLKLILFELTLNLKISIRIGLFRENNPNFSSRFVGPVDPIFRAKRIRHRLHSSC